PALTVVFAVDVLLLCVVEPGDRVVDVREVRSERAGDAATSDADLGKREDSIPRLKFEQVVDDLRRGAPAARCHEGLARQTCLRSGAAENFLDVDRIGRVDEQTLVERRADGQDIQQQPYLPSDADG